VTQTAEEIFEQAVSQRTRGYTVQAIASFREALRVEPDYPDAALWLGVMLCTTGEPAEAAKLLDSFVAQNTTNASAYLYLGRALHRCGSFDAAIEAFRACLRVDPNHAEAPCEMALAFLATARHDEAVAALRQLLIARPDYPLARSTLLHIMNLTIDDPMEILREHRRFEEDVIKRSVKPNDQFWGGRNPIRRIRVGYVSPNFKDHPISSFVLPLLENHNREVFQIHCYSDVEKEDAITKRIAKHADIWRNCAGKTDDQLGRQIWEDGIDILVDLTMHSPGGRPLLFAGKPAPIQVAWLPYPATTGQSAIDYRITDMTIDPLNTRDDLYAEFAVRVPHTFWCYDPLDAAPVTQSLPAAQKGYITFGGLHDASKITRQTIDLWAQVLNRVGDSRLLVPKDAEGEFLRHVSLERVEFIPPQPRSEYLRTFSRIDIALDTYPCNGHASSLDAFWMGVPVVTLSGNTGVSRGGLSHAANLDLSKELVAKTPSDFVELAIKLAADLPALAQLRAGLRDKMRQSPLTDGDRFARHVESAYQQMWRMRCRNA
jgi:protein O-GlcNAc transferase